MASTRNRSKSNPRGPEKIGKIMSVRFTPETVAKIDSLRGDLDFGTYVRHVIEDYLFSAEERAIRDCLEHNAQRGVTPEMLLSATKK